MSVFPFSPEVDASRDRFTGHELSKGTVRFTAARPSPDDLVRDIVRLRMDEISRAIAR
jgi:uncharacterized protein YdhG (YjbR/CyaY superfamily)